MMGPNTGLVARRSLTTKVTGMKGAISAGRTWVSGVLMWFEMKIKGPCPAALRTRSMPVISNRPRFRSIVRSTLNELAAQALSSYSPRTANFLARRTPTTYWAY
jgi:hypothetical protein